jgi:hypothetical protein
MENIYPWEVCMFCDMFVLRAEIVTIFEPKMVTLIFRT